MNNINVQDRADRCTIFLNAGALPYPTEQSVGRVSLVIGSPKEVIICRRRYH